MTTHDVVAVAESESVLDFLTLDHPVSCIMDGHSFTTTAHIDKLPADLMRDIFLMTLPGVEEEHPNRLRVETWLRVRLYSNHLQQDTLLPPLRISHVSQRWRKVALSFGSLWSNLSIAMRHTRETISPKIIEVFDTFIGRTGGCALRFHFCCVLRGREQDPQATFAAQHILTELLKEQRRWKDVVLYLLGFEPSSEFPGIRITDTSFLSALTISTRGVFVHLRLGQSSRLRRLDLEGQFELDCGTNLPGELRECRFYFFRGSASSRLSYT